MMKKTFKIIIISPFFILNFFSLGFSQDETITVTTYYPTPYGVYSILRLNPLDTGTLPACKPGEMAFSSASNRISLCIAAGSWQRLGLFSEIPPPLDPWLGAGNIYYLGRVGIGPSSLVLAQAGLTLGQLYTYRRAAASVPGASSPSCPCDSNPAGAPECAVVSFPSITDLGPTCVDLFDNAGTPSYYLYTQQAFVGGPRLRVIGSSSFDNNVGISMPIGGPLLYDLEVGGTLQADNYRGQTQLGITRTSTIPAGPITIREADNTADCHITVKNGLITASDCGHGCAGQPAGTTCGTVICPDTYVVQGIAGPMTTDSCWLQDRVDKTKFCDGAGNCSTPACDPPVNIQKKSCDTCKRVDECDPGGQTCENYHQNTCCGGHKICGTDASCTASDGGTIAGASVGTGIKTCSAWWAELAADPVMHTPDAECITGQIVDWCHMASTCQGNNYTITKTPFGCNDSPTPCVPVPCGVNPVMCPDPAYPYYRRTCECDGRYCNF